MSVQNTDLLLVQRGNVPYRETVDELSTKIRNDLDVTKDGDIPIASAAQLGVIRVGNNLEIDNDGVLAAVIPAGTSYEGLWSDADNPPTATINGQFWIWEGADATLNNALWGNANSETVSDNDRLLYDGTGFDILPAGSGGGGITAVTGTEPIFITTTDPDQPDVAIREASRTQDGYMPKEMFEKLDDLAAGGIGSLTAGNGLTNSGTATAPVLNVDFGALPNGDAATAKVMPYDISALGDLP